MKEGVVFWMDNYVILKGVVNKEVVYKFIDFLFCFESVKEVIEIMGFLMLNEGVKVLFLLELVSDLLIFFLSEEINKGVL